MDPISHALYGNVQVVEYTQEDELVRERLDINSFVALPALPDDASKDHECVILSSSSGSEGQSEENSSFDYEQDEDEQDEDDQGEDEQVVNREQGKYISEIVEVPELKAVIIHTEVASDAFTTTYTHKHSSSCSAGDAKRTKWKEVDSEFSPPIDILELQDSYHIYAEVPGMKVQDISIDLSNNLFSLTGGKNDHPLLFPESNAGVVVQEINRGRFKRVLELPDNVDTDGVTVGYEAGILQFKIRKIDTEKQPEEEAANDEEVQKEVVNANQEDPVEAVPEPQAGGIKRKHHKTKGGKKRSSCAIQ